MSKNYLRTRTVGSSNGLYIPHIQKLDNCLKQLFASDAQLPDVVFSRERRVFMGAITMPNAEIPDTYMQVQSWIARSGNNIDTILSNDNEEVWSRKGLMPDAKGI